MKRGIRSSALGVAVVVNIVALAVVNGEMVESAVRQWSSPQEPERIVIIAPKQTWSQQQALATQNCPSPKVI